MSIPVRPLESSLQGLLGSRCPSATPLTNNFRLLLLLLSKQHVKRKIRRTTRGNHEASPRLSWLSQATWRCNCRGSGRLTLAIRPGVECLTLICVRNQAKSYDPVFPLHAAICNLRSLDSSKLTRSLASHRLRRHRPCREVLATCGEC